MLLIICQGIDVQLLTYSQDMQELQEVSMKRGL